MKIEGIILTIIIINNNKIKENSNNNNKDIRHKMENKTHLKQFQ